MLRALWYVLKIITLVGGAVFLIVQPGDMQITWNNYTVSVQLGFAAFVLMLVVLVVAVLSGFMTRLSLLPERLRQHMANRKRSKGYRAIMQSLTAAATGDSKNAYDLAQRAQNLLPNDEWGLPLLLQAQTIAKQTGGVTSEKPYHLLLKSADTALLGLQGLTQNAILAGDYPKALLLARKAFQDNPKNLSLYKTIYDMEIRNQLWNDALITLDKGRKALKATDAKDRPIIYVILGDMARGDNRLDEAYAFYKKAYKLNNTLIPAVTRFASIVNEMGKTSKAADIIQRAWKSYPHPDFIDLWGTLMPPALKAKPHTHFQWMSKLVQGNQDNDLAQLALAKAAIDDQLWGDAKLALAKAEKFGASAEIYKTWILLEEKTGNNPSIIRQWLDRAYQCPAERAWICARTGRRFDVWQPIIQPEGLFNTLVWGREVDHTELYASSPNALIGVAS